MLEINNSKTGSFHGSLTKLFNGSKLLRKIYLNGSN
jgi:hypothetical protein